MPNKKRTAIVTGGAGFIGSHTVDLLLKKNYIVRVIDDFSGGHKKNLIHHKNNKDLIILKKNILSISSNHTIFKSVDYLFHYAGKGDIVPSIDNPKKYFKNNVFGTLNILEACRKNNIKKIIYAASSSCYGIARTPTEENNPIQNLYPYALSKYQGEQLVLHFSKVYDLKFISLRIFNAYGTRVRTTGVYGAVFGVFFKQKLAGLPLTIVGDGNQKRDFIYVTDVANAFIKSAESKIENQIINLGANNPQTINNLANIIGGKKIYLPKRPGEPDCTWSSNKKIYKLLKWKPKIKFEKGVKLMLKDINNWKDAPLWDKKTINKATKSWFKYMSSK